MGLFSRLANIATANLHALLDKVENPERVLAQIIREMEDALAAARKQAVDVLAGERRLVHELEKARQGAETWKARARLALDHQREDLARRSLARHLEQLDLMQTLHSQAAEARQTSEAVRAAVHALEDRVDEARRQQRFLHVHRRAAQVRAQADALAGAGSPRSPFARFAGLESRLAELEDDLLAYATIAGANQSSDVELTRLEGDHRLAGALATLKEERQSAPPLQVIR